MTARSTENSGGSCSRPVPPIMAAGFIQKDSPESAANPPIARGCPKLKMRAKPNESYDYDLMPGSMRFDSVCEAMIEIGGRTHELDDHDIVSLRNMIEYYRNAPAEERAELDEMVLERAKATRTALRMQASERAAM